MARFPIRHNLALLLSGIGLVLGILGLVLSWWETELEFDISNEQAQEFGLGQRTLSIFTAGPFQSEGNQDTVIFGGLFTVLDPAADDETTLIGILALLAAVALLATAGLVATGYFFPVLKPWMMHAPSGLALLLGGTSIILAPVLIPDAFAEEMNDIGQNFGAPEGEEIRASWFGDYRSQQNEEVWLNYSPSAGWWLSMAGFVLFPVAAALVHVFAKGLDTVRPEPAAEYLPPAATPPPALPTSPVFHGGAPSDSGGQRKRFVASPPPVPPTPSAAPAGVPSHYSTAGYSTDAPVDRYANAGYTSPIEPRPGKSTGYSSPVAPSTPASAAPAAPRKHLSVVKPSPTPPSPTPKPTTSDPRRLRKA